MISVPTFGHRGGRLQRLLRGWNQPVWPFRPNNLPQDFILHHHLPVRGVAKAPAGALRSLPKRELKFESPDVPARKSRAAREGRAKDPELYRNVEQWRSRSRVRHRRGVFKNLGYNPCGYQIHKSEPLKQTGSLLVDRRTLRATIGKRRTKVPGAVPFGPKKYSGVEYENSYALVISEGKLMMKDYHGLHGKALAKNLAFFQGGIRSCKQLKSIAAFIVEFGITARLYKKVALACLLTRLGKPNPAHRLLRSVADRCGNLRRKLTEHAIQVWEPSLYDSSSDSDW